MRSLLHNVVLIGFILACGDVASGEVFVLTNGGRVVGELLNPNESPRVKYVIKTASGGRITLAESRVKKRFERSPIEIEYEKLKAQCLDTVEGQWKLAEWCKENRLSARRKAHLARVIALDTNHKGARAALGYSQFDGQWRTQKEVMESRGLQRYKGQWMTPQQIEVAKRKEQRELAKKEWYAKIKRWKGWVGGKRTQEARKNFAAINDPAAVDALANFLARDRRLPVQAIYIETLARIGTGDALKALAVRSLEDPAEEVRLTCLDHLKKHKHPDVVAYYVAKLKHQKDNRMINRAGAALGAMGDTAAVGPLIDALVTIHKFKITTGSPGQTSAGFSSRGGAGLSAGSSTKIIKRAIQNPAVLEALIALTGGVNFSYDVAAWKSWYALKNKRAPLDARRG